MRTTKLNSKLKFNRRKIYYHVGYTNKIKFGMGWIKLNYIKLTRIGKIIKFYEKL